MKLIPKYQTKNKQSHPMERSIVLKKQDRSHIKINKSQYLQSNQTTKNKLLKTNNRLQPSPKWSSSNNKNKFKLPKQQTNQNFKNYSNIELEI